MGAIRNAMFRLIYSDADAEVANRIWDRASGRLLIPGKTFAAACGVTLSLSCFEGYIHLQKNPRTLQQWLFIFRYGMANLIPSFISGRIKAETIIGARGMDPNMVIPVDRTSRRYLHLSWRRTRLQAQRGAFATTMLLTQLLSMVQVITKATDNFADSIREGKEPPLLENRRQRHVVIRLAGETSDVTALSMKREGREKFFPVFENSSFLGVKKLVRKYGLGDNEKFGFPVYWQVHNGHYGHKESWQGMRIPARWLFDKKKKKPTDNDKVLVLEADAMNETSTEIWILDQPTYFQEGGLSLYEMTQGFFRLKGKVEEKAPPFDVLRVLLTDASAIVNRGAGGNFTVREFATDVMGMADVIIDTRAPLILSILHWLDARYEEIEKDRAAWRKLLRKNKSNLKPVILMTPNKSSFCWIQSKLAESGYLVLDYKGAQELCPNFTELPMMVYEPTTLDTVHTVERLIEDRESWPAHKKDMVCAICPTRRGLAPYGPGCKSEVFAICASDTYDYLLRKVREYAQEGHDARWIQKELDDNLRDIIAPKTFIARETLGFPPL